MKEKGVQLAFSSDVIPHAPKVFKLTETLYLDRGRRISGSDFRETLKFLGRKVR